MSTRGAYSKLMSYEYKPQKKLKTHNSQLDIICLYLFINFAYKTAIEQEAIHQLNSRPLTPPYVPFGIRRFHSLYFYRFVVRAEKINIPLFPTVCQKGLHVKLGYWIISSNPFCYLPVFPHFHGLLPVSQDSYIWFVFSSTSSKYSYGFFFSSIHRFFSAISPSSPVYNNLPSLL